MTLHPTTTLPVVFLLLVTTGAGAGTNEDDFAGQWSWAATVVPDLSRFQPLDLGGAPIDDLRKWVRRGKSIVVYDEQCRPIRISLHEGVLSGDTNIRTTYKRGIKKVEALTVQYGRTIMYLGPGWSEYEKDEKGRWVEVGGGGMGCLETRPGILNRVTPSAAWYDGYEATLKIKCGSPVEKTTPCEQGGSRTCRMCNSLQLVVRSITPGFGTGNIGTAGMKMKQSEPVDCTAPCPVDEKAGQIERLNWILEGRRFLAIGSGRGAPTLFRWRKMCENHRSKPRGKSRK